MNNQIIIGHVARAHGLKGDVAVVLYSEHPEQFRVGFRFDGSGGPLTIERIRPGVGVMLVKFVEVVDRDAAELLRGVQLTISDADLRELDEDEFWPADLTGLEVRDRAGERRGVIVDVLTGGAQDRLVVEVPTGRVEVPFVGPLVPVVDIAGGFVVVEAVPGLLETAD